MEIDDLRMICRQLPGVTEDIKWGNDLCFCIGGKMFLVVGLGETPVKASFKVQDEEFDAMSTRDGFVPAPYVARYKWVMVEDLDRMQKKEWVHFVNQSYRLVSDGLPKNTRKQIGLP